MRPAITRRQRNTPRLPTRAARRRTGIPRLRETPRTRASLFGHPSLIESRERSLRGSCHTEPELGPHVVRTPAKWRARDLSATPGYWPQTWTSLSQGHDGGVLGLLSAVAGVLVRGDAERLQVRMRQTPPVARCASHPPKRAERRRGAGGRCRCYWMGGRPRRSGTSPQPRCSASRSAGGRVPGSRVRGEPAGLRPPAIRRRRWTASPGAGLQAAHPRPSSRRQYLQGQHLRCRRRSPLADHRRSRLSLRPRWRPQ